MIDISCSSFIWIMKLTLLKRVSGTCVLPRILMWFCVLTSVFGVYFLVVCMSSLISQDQMTRFIPDTPSSPSSYFQPLNENNTCNGLNNLSDCFPSPSCVSIGETEQCRQSVFENTFACKHLVTLKYNNYGRTGNQMFQVAALLGTASYHGYTAVIDSSMKIKEIFDLPNLYANTKLIFNEKTTITLWETGCCIFNEHVRNISHQYNWTLGGYLQSWKYFEGAENIVRNAFRLKDHLIREARKFINSKVDNSSNTQTITIHVRRGDFIKLHDKGYMTAPLEYIKKATEYFRSKFVPEHVHFFVVSDDKEWCRKNLRWQNVTISPFNTVGLDMALMAISDHVIVTSGTFGWWGAWLSRGETVYWKGFPKKNTFLGKQTNFEDYYPRHWIGIDLP